MTMFPIFTEVVKTWSFNTLKMFTFFAVICEVKLIENWIENTDYKCSKIYTDVLI